MSEEGVAGWVAEGLAMLVYANYLELKGKDAYKAVFSALCGWVKKKTGSSIKPTELMGTNQFNLGDVWISTEIARKERPHLYAVTLKHPDISVRGRQWIVEVGMNVTTEKTVVSVVLKTDEMSSLVNSDVFTTRPLLIRYISKNSKLSDNAIGLSFKNVSGNTDAYRGLLFDVERVDRDYPIVLVSPDGEGKYPVEVPEIQEQLIGLAQVVKISTEYNSYEMAEVLGQRFSAWNGAINILYTPFKTGHVRNKLFQSNYLKCNFASKKELISFLLSTVTHNTNIPKVRKQIRPEVVKAKSLKERFISRKGNSQTATVEEIDEILEIAASQERQFKEDIERVELEKLQLEEDKDLLENDLAKAKWNIGSLKRQLLGVGKESSSVDTNTLLKTACRVDEPTPRECISIISSVSDEQIIFLDSAIDSAKRLHHLKEAVFY